MGKNPFDFSELVNRFGRLLPSKPLPHPRWEGTSANELVAAIGPASSSVAEEAETLWKNIKSGDRDDLTLEQLVNLIIRAKVEFPGDSMEGIFLTLFVSLRSFMDNRHHPYVNALFDAAVRSAHDLEEKKQADRQRDEWFSEHPGVVAMITEAPVGVIEQLKEHHGNKE